ncbi:MAG TPA: YHS domain-containing protein [Nitrososphaeraceae archaeon]
MNSNTVNAFGEHSINRNTIYYNLMPVDPVCGIEMDEDLATIHEYNGRKYYFCCEGCKSIFSRKPGKYSKK